MQLVVGLGNPGPDYRDTRHNLGFRVVETIRHRRSAGPERELCGALVSEARGLIVARPQTFMNRSGWAVRCLVERYEIAPDRCLVVYDEVALPLGRLRLRPGGSPAGHRGMESVVEAMQTEAVPRLRLGIAPAEGGELPDDLAPFVLGPFAPAESDAVETMLARAADAVELWAAEGVEAAMSRFNG